MTALDPEIEVDVVIVGCGPVGAFAATLLGAERLSTIVLEREPEAFPLPRAVHLDHEMMRLFQSAGVIDRLLPNMVETDGHIHIGADRGVIRYMGTVGKPRPFGWANDYFFFQPELEAGLRSKLAELPSVDLRLGAQFKSLKQHADQVCVKFLHEGREQIVKARWLIGCDGAKSSVRKHLGIALDDLQFDEPWLVVDAEVEGEIAFPELTDVPVDANLQRLSVMMCDPARPATIVPGRGSHRRWEFMLLPGEIDQEMMQPARAAELLEDYLRDTPHKIIRASTYRFHGLVAEQWQVGNVFLAGDAAHQTPPFFGQGMCHGLRDVANLAWKMAAICHSLASPDILGTYQAERDPHVRTVIGAALAAGRYICELDPQRAAERDRMMRERATAPRAQTAADLIPAIGAGLIIPGTPAAGERFIQPILVDGRKLDDAVGGGWRLFVRDGTVGGTSQDVTRFECDALADKGALTAWLDAKGVDAVVVRPDHYVFATASNSAESILRQVSERVFKLDGVLA